MQTPCPARAAAVLLLACCLAPLPPTRAQPAGTSASATPTPPAPAVPAPTAAPAPPSRTHAAITKDLKRACDAGDEPRLAVLLDELWESDPRAGRDRAFDLVQNGTPSQRVVGTAVLARLGKAKDIAAAASNLRPSIYPDERRWLVRSLGLKLTEEGPGLLERFVEDHDPLVRAAAIAAIADTGHASGVGLFIKRLDAIPCRVGTWDDDDSSIVSMAVHGALRTLTGLRPTTTNEIQRWWKDHKDALPAHPSPSPPGDTAEPEIARDGTVETSSFNVSFKVRNARDTVAQMGVPDAAELARGLEASAARSKAVAARVFGPVHLPVVRLFLVDQRHAAAYGGVSQGYYGFANGNEVVMRAEDWRIVQSVLLHEYLHIIHMNHYQEQPRWLSEGVADSLTRSPDASGWTLDLIHHPETQQLVERGGVSSAADWTVSSNTAGDAHLYLLSHIVVDYLRHGPFAEPDARLAFLMGRLSRGEPPERALQTLYGRPVRGLDAGLVEWLRTNDPGGQP